jgi:hypothetical protein
MNAQEASRLARERNQHDSSEAMAVARAAIKAAAEQGKYSAAIYKRLPADACLRLRDEGYHLREWSDPRGEDGCEISWVNA